MKLNFFIVNYEQDFQVVLKQIETELLIGF